MKKIFSLFLVTVFVIGMVQVVAAATDSDEVTVTVAEIDIISVPSSTSITLTTTTAGEADYKLAEVTDAEGLSYTHNSTTNKKITVQAAAAVGNDGNDITLIVALSEDLEVISGNDTVTPVTLVSVGTVDPGSGILWTAIPAGGYTVDLNWTAVASVGGTKAGSYIWTVTFTSADA